jgi:predicted dehydrogenase
MSRIGIAVIGLGNAFVPYARCLQDLRDRVDLRWAVARSETRLAPIQAQYGCQVTTDAAQALNDPAVQAMFVLAPPNVHLELCGAAFAAGKHVLCEKPLEISVDRAERLVAAGRQANRRMAVMLQLRFRSASLRLQQILREGGLGEIQGASMAVNWWRPQAYFDEPGRGTLWRDGGGVLITQAIHTIDLFRSLVGISEVTASQVATTDLHRMEAEDYAAALVRLGNGAPGTISATVAAYPGTPEAIQVIGTSGTARMEAGNLRVSWLDGREEVLEDAGGSGGGANLMGFSHGPHKALIADFLDAIDTDRDPAVTGEDALATQRVIAAILSKGAN